MSIMRKMIYNGVEVKKDSLDKKVQKQKKLKDEVDIFHISSV